MKRLLISVGIMLFSALILGACASSKPVSTEIVEQYPLAPIEEIMTSERSVQELMSDTRQYFKKSYVGISTDANQTDPTLISMRFYPVCDTGSFGSVGYTCDFNVNVEFKSDGRIRFNTENIYIGMFSAYMAKTKVGGHDWMMPQVGVNTNAIRIAAGQTYNKIIEEMTDTLRRIAAGKTEYTW